MIKIFRKDYTYDKDIDVLVRVYENQSKEYTEKEQIACEVLFKAHCGREHERFTAWLPRGAVVAVVKVLNRITTSNWKVQISNELSDNIGVLTHCRENFDKSMEWEKLSCS